MSRGEPSRMPISFSIKHAGSKVSPLNARKVWIDHDMDEDVHASGKHADVPLSGKRKRDDAAASSSRTAAPRPKVIPLISSSNWHDERRRRIGLSEKHGWQSEPLTPGSKRLTSLSRQPPDELATEQAFSEPSKQGLVRRAPKEGTERDSTPPAEQISSGASTPTESFSTSNEPTDHDALQALLAEEKGAVANPLAKVIQQPNEEEMFHRDVGTRPNEPTLDDYQSMPVEEFGAAMLRGMGWKEGMGAGKRRNGPAHAPIIQRRAALLGLGAKERASPTMTSGQRRDVDRHYKPVTSRDNRSRHSASYGPDRYRENENLPRREKHGSNNRSEHRYQSQYGSYHRQH